jgi:hypothetical protein
MLLAGTVAGSPKGIHSGKEEEKWADWSSYVRWVKWVRAAATFISTEEEYAQIYTIWNGFLLGVEGRFVVFDRKTLKCSQARTDEVDPLRGLRFRRDSDH